MNIIKDWGEVSETFEEILAIANKKILEDANEAQTRFDVIDRIIREILQWQYGQITVEPHSTGVRNGYIDYILLSGDIKIIIEAKRIGASFPSPTKKKKLKLSGIVLGSGSISEAITQAGEYAIDQNADLIGVTNGRCWCFFTKDAFLKKETDTTTLFFPFDDFSDGEAMFNYLSSENIETNGLDPFSGNIEYSEVNRLRPILKDGDARIDRNSIADYISPALDNALNGEAIVNDPAKLEYCFVSTDTRTKYDNVLNMHIADGKPYYVLPAKRIKKNKDKGELHEYLDYSENTSNSPVTLVIGAVGSGKSTYLKHFELIQGRSAIDAKKCHWIYIDFERMGKTGNPRKFIYDSLNTYLLDDDKRIKTDYKSTVEPAYRDEIDRLGKGPFGLMKHTNPAKFAELVQEQIAKDYNDVEPYVDKVFSYISKRELCVIILDNVDLYEDELLETTVFSEGIALSKKVKCNIIASIRDTTFVKHRNDSTFNAFELKKLWLDPPSFREVLSKRLSFAKEILKNKQANITLPNGAKLYIPDLSVFFEIAHTSLLSQSSGHLIENLCNGDIRHGITLVTTFLTSGHIQADRAIKNYLDGNLRPLPPHEIFKGSILGQWKYYREDRADAVNLFNSKLGPIKLQLLRIFIINFLIVRAKNKDSVETPFSEILQLFSKLGASTKQLLEVLNFLYKNKLVRSTDVQDINESSSVFVTQSGGYYSKILCKRMDYVELVMLDTPILTNHYWEQLSPLTDEIDHEHSIVDRMSLRKERLEIFLKYLGYLESTTLGENSQFAFLKCIDDIAISVNMGAADALRKSKKWYT